MHKYILNFEQLFNYHIMDLYYEGVMYILGRRIHHVHHA